MRVFGMALCLMATLLTAAPAAAAQETAAVTGRVTDSSTGQPLMGVHVQVRGTNLGAITDQEGRYLLSRVPAGSQTIQASLIGYAQASETLNLAPGETGTADFSLETSAVALEALVVSAATGREQRAREIGAKVTAIEVGDLNPAPITSFADAIGGRAEGLILQDVGGTTGGSQRIRIRGANSLSLSNEPLIYVDGVQINSEMGRAFAIGGQQESRLNDLAPGNIESIEVVKGPAAAALYGTAAANGVILITTKRGRPGETQWSAFVESGTIEDVTPWPTNWLSYAAVDPDADAPLFDEDGMFNDEDYFECPNWANALTATNDTLGYFPVYGCDRSGTIDFNTLQNPLTTPYSTGSRQRYGASVRGGTDQVQYFLSGQFEDETGVIEYNQQQKVNLRANVDAQLSEAVNVSVSMGYADVNLDFPQGDNNIFSPIINGLLGSPYLIPADTTRRFGAPVNDRNYGFGYSPAELAYLPSTQDVGRTMASANLRWRPTSWLAFNANAGMDATSAHNYETLQPGISDLTSEYWAGYRSSERYTTYLYSGQASGVATFQLMPELISTTTLGGSYSRENTEGTECYGSSLVPGTASCGTVSDLYSIDETFFEVRTIGGYVQQELGWRDRVFVAAGLRADQNSNFGTEFGLVTYPSASLSWVVAEEEWFPDLDVLTTLRLRTAWGVSGLQPGFRDATTIYEPTTVAMGVGDRPGVTLDVTGNPQLEPERTTEWEAGFDSGFFDDRLSLEFTYFNKVSRDALINRSLPGSLGLTEDVFANLGSIQNQGTELALNLMVFESEDFGLNVGFTNTTLSNEIVELGEGVEPITFNRGAQRHEEGYSAGGFWQPEISWEDADGNGLLSPYEVQVDTALSYIGPSLPTWQRAVFADARLFDWLTVSTLVEGRGGHYSMNYTEGWRCGTRTFEGCDAVANPDASLEEQAAYLAWTWGDPVTEDVSSIGWIQPGDFYKWREMAVTLSTPEAWGQRFRALEGVRLTLAGRNLATWTDYGGIDPEANETGGDSGFTQGEFNTQPPARYLMVRLDYTF